MSHRKTDLGIPGDQKSAKVVLEEMEQNKISLFQPEE
jgi:hypothetical protein